MSQAPPEEQSIQCHLQGSQASCTPSVAIQTVVKQLIWKNEVQLHLLKEILVGDEGIAGDGSLWPTDLLHCDDQTLLNNIYGAGVLYAAKQGKEVGGESSKLLYDGNTVNNHEMDHHLFLTLLNPEPLLAQILPTSDYWPTFLGACGRMAVFQDMGGSLKDFGTSSWRTRAELALQLIRLAMLLTKNELGLSFYLTDWAAENFAVATDSMKVSLVDLEHLIVVNTSRLEAEAADAHISDNWGSRTSLSFSPSSLCEHSSSDHNYLGLCSILLAHSPMSSFSGGLLHSPPPHIVASNLTELLRSCWKSTEVGGRKAAVRQLEFLLEQELRKEKEN